MTTESYEDWLLDDDCELDAAFEHPVKPRVTKSAQIERIMIRFFISCLL